MDSETRHAARQVCALASAVPAIVLGLYYPHIRDSYGAPSFAAGVLAGFSVIGIVILASCALVEEPAGMYLARAFLGFGSGLAIGIGITYLDERPYLAVLIVNAPILPVALFTWYSRHRKKKAP